ncbi:MAG: BREX-6 system phosphatase PglZ [Planctomycetaceae bacterium]|nr:BREX-6 system phosphatase PglZ [Planctomycetaceae bacterium]
MSRRPVSDALEEHLQSLVRQHGIYVWRDPQLVFRRFADKWKQRLADSDRIAFPLLVFDGSMLELMLQLAPHMTSIERPRVLIYAGGLSDEQIRESPLLQACLAGQTGEYHPDALIKRAATGRVPADLITQHLEQPFDLGASNRWLRSLLQRPPGSELLHDVGLEELLDDLLQSRRIATQLDGPDAGLLLPHVKDHLHVKTGMPAAWWEPFDRNGPPTSRDVAMALLGWCQCVSFVQDLAVAPQSALLTPICQLDPALQQDCHQLVLRSQQGDPSRQQFYRMVAARTQDLLVPEHNILATHLGTFDTFLFEDDTILEATLQAVLDGSWDVAQIWCEQRAREDSFWLQEDTTRRNTWRLAQLTARLGAAIVAAGSLSAADSVTAAAATYTQRGAAVDRAHRELLQWQQLLIRKSLLPDTLRACCVHVQQVWSDWARQWATDFNAVCQRDGFLPTRDRQQRFQFEDRVRPLIHPEQTVALFCVDALRYEMAVELAEALAGDLPDDDISLDWQLAELPSVTAVGMNVLAPVADAAGRLELRHKDGELQGFSQDTFRVHNPETRKQAMHRRAGGNSCPYRKLEDLISQSDQTIRRSIGRARLLLIHSARIDIAGEQGLGPDVFAAELERLRTAIALLKRVGVTTCLITADHGYLLLDRRQATPATARQASSHRYDVVETQTVHHSSVSVSLQDLNYTAAGLSVVFPDGISTFDCSRPVKSFLHGGNSLQERVIPVLTVSTSTVPTVATAEEPECRLQLVPQPDVLDFSCVMIRVQSAGEGLFPAELPESVMLQLRVEDPTVRVQLCDVRGGDAVLKNNRIVAPFDQECELFFQLHGAEECRVPVTLSAASPQITLAPVTSTSRFDVRLEAGLATGADSEDASSGPTTISEDDATAAADWLSHIDDEGARSVFAHLQQHGSVSDDDLTRLLPNARAQRRFANNYERYARVAPFSVRLDVNPATNAKLYLREGRANDHSEQS